MALLPEPMPYSFRSLTPEDFPMLRAWLDVDEVRTWWGDPVIEFTLIRQDFAEPDITMQIVGIDGVDFAYVQHYPVHEMQQPHGERLPTDTRAIDTFIGNPEYIGKGHGSAYLAQLCEELLAHGTPVLVIDPAPENLRARRAYTAAGFEDVGEFDSPEGRVVLMQRRANT